MPKISSEDVTSAVRKVQAMSPSEQPEFWRCPNIQSPNSPGLPGVNFLPEQSFVSYL